MNGICRKGAAVRIFSFFLSRNGTDPDNLYPDCGIVNSFSGESCPENESFDEMSIQHGVFRTFGLFPESFSRTLP